MGDDTARAVGVPLGTIARVRSGRTVAFRWIGDCDANGKPFDVVAGSSLILVESFAGHVERERIRVGDVLNGVVIVATPFDELWSLGGVQSMHVEAPNHLDAEGEPARNALPYWQACVVCEARVETDVASARMLSKSSAHDALHQVVRQLKRDRENG
jgi:hypothetical protein